MKDGPEPIDVHPRAVVISVTVPPVMVWHHDSFAEAWLRDAKREAGAPDPDARRREVVFAVAFAESFLFEWIRDQVLGARRWGLLTRFFDKKQGICDRWKSVVKQLHSEKLIPQAPAFGGAVWRDFRLLVDLRDSYLHASASMPEQPGQKDVAAVSASRGTHRQIALGWPTRAAVAQALALVADCQRDPPDWLQR